MGQCMNCEGTLQPQWRFCVYCGTALESSSREIPSAIRPDVSERAPRRRVDIPMIVGIALGVAGVALVIYMAVVLTGSG